MPKVSMVERNVTAVDQSSTVDPFMDDMDIDLDNLETFEKPASKKSPSIIYEGQVDVITSEVAPPKN